MSFWHFTSGKRRKTTPAVDVSSSNTQVCQADFSKISETSPSHAALDCHGIDIGTKLLIVEGRLSPSVVSHVHFIYCNWKDVDLYTHSPFGGKNAANLEARERGWSLLIRSGDGLADQILLIGLQHTLLDSSHAERFSKLYSRLIMRWTEICSECLDKVGADDIPLRNLLIWLCMKLAASMVASFLRLKSASEEDPRFRLTLKMMERYPEIRDWAWLEYVLKQFHWEPHCMHFWHILWNWFSSWPGGKSKLAFNTN